MDGDAGGGDPDTRRRSEPFAGDIHINLGGRTIGPVTSRYAEAARRREAADRRREEAAERAREAARRRRTKSRRPASSEAASGTGTCVRQSILYSDRPRRSRGRRQQSSPIKSRAEEDASGSEICSTTAHMASVHAGSVDRGGPDSATAEPSAVEESLSPRRLAVGGSGTRLRQSAIYSDQEGPLVSPNSPNSSTCTVLASAMDGNAGGGDLDTCRRSEALAGDGSSTRPYTDINLGGRNIGPVTLRYAEAFEREAAARRRQQTKSCPSIRRDVHGRIIGPVTLEYVLTVHREAAAARESATEAARLHQTKSRTHGSSEPASGIGTRVRQRVLYSDRSRQSRGRRGQSPSKSLSVPDPTTTEQPAVEEVLSPRSEKARKLRLYLAEHTFDSLEEGFAVIVNGYWDPPKNVAVPNAELSKAELFSLSPHHHEFDAQKPRQTFEVPKVSESISSATEDLARRKVSTKEIIQNAKQWMSDEVMLAFEKYIEGKDECKDVVYNLDELQYQCFSVETYQKTFHHYNFAVKMKKSTSQDWSLTNYFAEVKQIYGETFYKCCPLESYDNGYCHGCKNQGMEALKHPSDHIGFEIGHFTTGCPFMYDDDSDDDERGPMCDGVEDDDVIFEMYE